MTTGEYIKWCRLGNNKYGTIWTQEELGLLLDPPVKRAAINKWELGTVVNIRKPYIEQMAKIFGIQPGDLMCFDERYDTASMTEELATIESIQKLWGRSSVQILQYFNELNEHGKEKIMMEILDMLGLPKYSKDSRWYKGDFKDE